MHKIPHYVWNDSKLAFYFGGVVGGEAATYPLNCQNH